MGMPEKSCIDALLLYGTSKCVRLETEAAENAHDIAAADADAGGRYGGRSSRKWVCRKIFCYVLFDWFDFGLFWMDF